MYHDLVETLNQIMARPEARLVILLIALGGGIVTALLVRRSQILKDPSEKSAFSAVVLSLFGAFGFFFFSNVLPVDVSFRYLLGDLGLFLAMFSLGTGLIHFIQR